MSGSKLTFRWGIPYALLSFARDGVYVFVMSYYFVYLYQVIGLSGVFLAAMFVVLKIIDIVKEPFLGMLLDYSAAKFKFNKFRTFVVAGGIVNSVITATMFNLHAQPTTGIYALSALLLFVWNLTFSVIDLPAWSVSATLDTNNEKREQISALARAFQVLGFCTILIVSSYMFHQDSSIPSVARQTPVLAFNHGGCWIALMELTITFLFALLFNRPEVQRNVVPLKDTLKAFFGNDQLMITWCITILQQIAFFVFVASHGYFLLSLPYLPTGKEVFVLIQLPWLFVAIISFAMYQPLVKIFSRKKIFIFSLVLAVISETSLLIITYLGFLNFPMLAVMMSLCSIAFALNLTSTTVMTADCVDYGEFKFLSRAECMNFSVQTMSSKFGTLIAALVSGFSFSYADIFSKNETLTEQMYSVNLCVVLLWICAGIMIAIYLTYYKLHGSFFENILNSINNFKDGSNGRSAGREFFSVRYALDEQCVIYKMNADNLNDILLKLTDRLYSIKAISSKPDFLKGVYDKIVSCPVGIAHGIAIPHARGPYVNRPALAVATLTTPLDLGSSDGQACDLIFLIAVPDDGMTHINLLGNLSLMLSEPGFANKLRNSGSSEEITKRLIACEKHLFN